MELKPLLESLVCAMDELANCFGFVAVSAFGVDRRLSLGRMKELSRCMAEREKAINLRVNIHVVRHIAHMMAQGQLIASPGKHYACQGRLG
jgi:hypothetical protein